MVKRETSGYAYLREFHNRLIGHAKEVFNKTVGETLKNDGHLVASLFDYFDNSKPHFYDFTMGQPWWSSIYPDIVFVDRAGNFAIYIDATVRGVVEVRNGRFWDAAEKFAIVWEKERQALIPILLDEVKACLQRSISTVPYFENYASGVPEVTLIHAYSAQIRSG